MKIKYKDDEGIETVVLNVTAIGFHNNVIDYIKTNGIMGSIPIVRMISITVD